MHWLSFFIGVLVGWLIEWLIDLLFWRRRWRTLRQGHAGLRAELERERSERTTLRAELERTRAYLKTRAEEQASAVDERDQARAEAQAMRARLDMPLAASA